jgi:hypothetical protein
VVGSWLVAEATVRAMALAVENRDAAALTDLRPVLVWLTHPSE